MDRFIAQGNGITYDTITDLKSNMDRFIVRYKMKCQKVC